jgi:O-antigen ligase
MGAVEIMLFGGRGPLFAYICFISLYFVFVWLKDHEVKHKWLKIFGIILGVSILYSSLNSIMQVISNMLSSHGIQSRFFVLFTSGKIADDNGRAWIQTRVINLINQKSVFSGYGPLADSYYVEYYSHNIVLELALEFGIVFGGMIIVLILVEMLRLLITCKDEEFCILFLVFVACGFIKLFFSSTFWQESLFWMMLAMMFNFRKYKYGMNTDE